MATDVYKDFSSNKEMFHFSNYSTESKYCDDSNKLVIGKVKDETSGVVTEEFVGMKAKVYLFLIDDNSEHKIANGGNRNVNTTINYKKYKNVLLNNKCFRHLLNRIQNKDHRIGTCEINKIPLSCFDDKTYIRNNGYNELVLGY